MRSPRSPAVLLSLALALFVPAASARNNPLVVFPNDADQLPAIRYGKLPSAACLRELRARGIAFGAAKARPTVETPVTFPGTLHGVAFELAQGAPEAAKKSVLDCRLLLALDDLAGIAAEQHIRSIRYNSIVRGGWARRGQRHQAGVAIDVVEFVKDDGGVLNVRRDFEGERVGAPTCGERAPSPKPGKPSELRALVCALDRARVFNLVLTPHYDRRHDDHFHLEVRRGIRWFLTQ